MKTKFINLDIFSFPPYILSIYRVTILLFLMLTWEGVIPVLFGLKVYLGKQLISFAIIGANCLSVSTAIYYRKFTISIDSIVSIFALGYAFCISVIYSTNNNLALNEWLFASYYLAAFLIPSMLKLLKVTWLDVVFAVIFAVFICSLVSIADQFFKFQVFEDFVRGSINDRSSRRMFFMRAETGSVVCTLAIFAVVYYSRIGVISLISPILCSSAVVLFIISESRQSITASLIGFVIFMLVSKLSMRQWLVRLPILMSGGVGTLTFFLWKYIEKFTNSSDYLRDGNIYIRLQSINFYSDKFNQTSGLGFGILSSGDNARNFFALAQRHGNGNWPFWLADTGILSSLFQFGWLGLAFAFLMPIWLGWRLIRVGRRLTGAASAVAFGWGCFLIGSVIHPWPQNYFTLDWSIMFGALSWYVAMDAERSAGLRSGVAVTF